MTDRTDERARAPADRELALEEAFAAKVAELRWLCVARRPQAADDLETVLLKVDQFRRAVQAVDEARDAVLGFRS